MSGSNVVPMPMPQQSVWPMPSMLPVPGCCPPGGMDALMKCYCDIQAATAFICTVMIDCINQNPAVAEAMIAAIEKSGSSLPLIGVTNGTDAQPGQVGEFLHFTQAIPYTGNNTTTNFTVSVGVIPPGDWNIWSFTDPSFAYAITSLNFFINPQPAGMSDALHGEIFDSGQTASMISSNMVRGSFAVPTLIAVSGTVVSAAGGAAANLNLIVSARRMR